MILKVPHWCTTIEDEGVLLFAAFCNRICTLHGFDTQYSIHVDDVSRMCNKRTNGLEDWLRSYPEIQTNIKLGKLYDDVIIFELKSPIPDEDIDLKRGPKRKSKTYDIELLEQRSTYIWIYLLGCLNSNFIEGKRNKSKYLKNTFGIKEFYVDREPMGYTYVKKKEKQ